MLSFQLKTLQYGASAKLALGVLSISVIFSGCVTPSSSSPTNKTGQSISGPHAGPSAAKIKKTEDYYSELVILMKKKADESLDLDSIRTGSFMKVDKSVTWVFMTWLDFETKLLKSYMESGRTDEDNSLRETADLINEFLSLNNELNKNRALFLQINKSSQPGFSALVPSEVTALDINGNLIIGRAKEYSRAFTAYATR